MHLLFPFLKPTDLSDVVENERVSSFPVSSGFLITHLRAAILMFLFTLFFGVNPIQAQTRSNEINTIEPHSPRRATLYSAVLPGLGQAYNRKFWKMPIIYAGLGTLYYITKENTQEYNKFLEAYRYVVAKDTFPINNEYVGRYNEAQLLQGKNMYRRNVEVGYILAGALYLLNIIDASVDAHLFNYDVGDDLSLKIEPAVLRDPVAARHFTGVSLTLRF